MKYLIICSAIILSSCIETKEKKEALQTNDLIQKSSKMNNIFPYTDENANKFYNFDTELGRYVVNVNENKMMKFNSDKADFPVKENDFGIRPTVNGKYAEIETLNFSSLVSCKVIVYNTIGDNDTAILNVQLNSYHSGQLKDQLLLDSRFTFETEYYRTFIINKNQSIKINKFSVNNLEFNEAGDILGDKKVADTVKVTVSYQLLNDGFFKKL